MNEDITNWLELHDWLRGLGAPETKQEFVQKNIDYVDAFVILYNSHNKPLLKVKFLNTVITSLDGIDFTETVLETETRKVNANFKYERYDITKAV